MKKVLFTATVDSHILLFHLPYLKYFKEKGYKVYVATNGSEHIPFCDEKILIPFARSPYKIDNLKAIFKLKKVLLKEKFDIIHTHTPMGSVVTRLAAKKSRKKYGTKLLYTAHGFHFYKGASKLNWLLFYPVEKFLSRFTDILITINQEDYELACKKFHTEVHYVPGVGIDENKFDFDMLLEDKINLRKSIGLKREDFVCIYAAELSKRKNQEWLLNSMKGLLIKYPNMHILLPGKDSMDEFHKRLACDLDIEKQVHFLGFRKDIPELLSISDLAISTSKQEGLPVNIMEAMYLGLPIIATDCRGNRDLVVDGKNGYIIKQNDSKTWNDKIEYVYLHLESINVFSNYSKQIIHKYVLENVLCEMKKIYSIVE